MTDKKNLINEDQFRDMFFNKIVEKFGSYIESRCYIEAAERNDPILKPDDMIQEVYLHILKYSLDAARERSTKDKIWLPSINKILRNVFINASYKPLHNMHSRLNIQPPKDNSQDEEYIYGESPANQLEQMEYKESIEQIANQLTEDDRILYYELVRPSKNFKDFLIKNTAKNRKIRPTKTITAKYLGIPYPECIQGFRNIKTAMDNL